AYDASRVRIKEAEEEPEENIIYSVASNTANVRVQRAVDPEVAALLDDSDASRFDSDVEDLEEDFVVQANLCEDEDDEENANTSNGNNFDEESTMNRSLDNEHVLQVSDYSTVADAFGPLDEGLNGATGVHSAGEQPRPRRLLDVQFDLLESQEYASDDHADGDDDDIYGDYEENYLAEEKSLAEKLKLSLSNDEMDSPKLDESGKYKVPKDEKEQDGFAGDVIRRCKEYGQQYEVQDDDKDVVIFEESSDESEVWDCETIVSTYSNLDNHPGMIEIPGFTRKKKLTETVTAAFSSSNPIISLSGKAKLPADFLPGGRKPAAEKVKDVSTEKTELYKRKKHGLESKEEKKERKAAVKEERREARRTKKEMKELYKCEANRAQRTAAGSGASSYHIL
ncbi:LTV1-like protein, partial [Trifolium pratense]